MKKPVLFVHSAGVQGNHEGSVDFVESLRKGLGAEYDVLFPVMPDPENPSYNRWREELDRSLETIREDCIVIGHSLGGSVLLKYFSDEPWKLSVAGLFVVAAPYWGADGWPAGEFALRGSSSKVDLIPLFLYHSRDDDVVPFAHLTRYEKRFKKAAIRSLDGYGHYFREGCRRIIEDMTSLASSPELATGSGGAYSPR